MRKPSDSPYYTTRKKTLASVGKKEALALSKGKPYTPSTKKTYVSKDAIDGAIILDAITPRSKLIKSEPSVRRRTLGSHKTCLPSEERELLVKAVVTLGASNQNESKAEGGRVIELTKRVQDTPDCKIQVMEEKEETETDENGEKPPKKSYRDKY